TSTIDGRSAPRRDLIRAQGFVEAVGINPTAFLVSASRRPTFLPTSHIPATHPPTQHRKELAVPAQLEDTNEPTETTYESDPVFDLAVQVDTTFWSDAACGDSSDVSVQLFFSDELVDIAKAKRICAQCPVLESCLEGALARKEPLGVWGGQL